MAVLKIPPARAVSLIHERLDDLKAVQQKREGSAYYNFVGWCSKTWRVIDEIYGSDDIRAEEIRSMGMPSCSCRSPAEALPVTEQYVDLLMKYLNEIQEGMRRKE